jgi:hypothetical protein
MVGDFIRRQTCPIGHVLRQVVEATRGLSVGNDELAACMQLGERRALLDGELIERQMLA